MLFYSMIFRKPIYDANGRRLGYLRDLALQTDSSVAVVSGLVLKRWPNQRWLLPWDRLESMSLDSFVLKAGTSLLEYEPPTNSTRLLGRDVLDSQVVDVNGAKVVRVNDIQLAATGGQLAVIGVDIGLWGLARQLGLAEALSSLSHYLRFKVPEGLVGWDLIEPLGKGRTGVQLKVTRDRISRLHPADLAEIFSDLGYEQRSTLLSELDDAQVAGVLEEMEPDEAAEVLSALDNERAADVLEEMEPDEAADVLGELSEGRAEQLMGLMDAEEAEEVRELLAYEGETAGGLMTTNYVTLAPHSTVAQALAALKAMESEVEIFSYVYLVDEDEKLQGVVALREMLVAAPETPLNELSPDTIYQVEVDDEQEEALRLLLRYGLQAIPVVEDGRRLAGVITLLDAIEPLIPEHLK